jgi:hypothetical protein
MRSRLSPEEKLARIKKAPDLQELFVVNFVIA